MISIILQAGGKSSRMGKDKATVPFLGVPLIYRLRDRFDGFGTELLVITNEVRGYKKLGVPLFEDIIPERGALGGLYTALSIASQPLIGLIAADMPFANPDLIKYQMQIIQDSGFDAVIPGTEQGIEPFHSVYRVETCLPLVKEALENNLWKMISWHDQARIKVLNPDVIREITGSGHTFRNLNTPEEFQEAEEIAKNIRDY